MKERECSRCTSFIPGNELWGYCGRWKANVGPSDVCGEFQPSKIKTALETALEKGKKERVTKKTKEK